MNVRIKLGVVAASVAALALSACGSSSLSGETGASTAPSVSVSQNVDLSAKLPESIKNAGVIKIGVDASYAPNEFLAGDGKTVQGMDVDVFNAVAAKFGVKTEWHPADFGSIINGVNGKKYDMGISSFTINPERMKQVNMVSYFRAGTQWATAKGNPKGVDPDNACGKNIAVQSNTVARDGRPAGAPEEVRQQQDQRLVLQGPEPGHRRRRQRQGRRHAVRLAGRRLRGEAIRRQSSSPSVTSTRRPRTVMCCRRRDRVRTGNRRGAQGDRQGRRLQSGPREVGRSAGRHLRLRRKPEPGRTS